MQGQGVLFGQIAAVFGIVIAGVWGATQWTAAALGYQLRLGSPWFDFFGTPVYHPWRLFEWWFFFDAYAPQVFDTGGMIAAGSGLLAVVVASPCTAPFMGGALGYAVTQPPLLALLVFVALGLGMALPFLLLAYLPALARALPKPGAWMETLKQLLAFPLYLSAVWLVWVFGRQAGIDAVAVLLCGMVAIAAACWLYGSWQFSRAGWAARYWRRCYCYYRLGYCA